MPRLTRLFGVLFTLFALPGCASVSGMFSQAPAFQAQTELAAGTSRHSTAALAATPLAPTSSLATPARLGASVSADQITRTPTYDLTVAPIVRPPTDVVPTSSGRKQSVAGAFETRDADRLATLPSFFSAMGEPAATRTSRPAPQPGPDPDRFDPQTAVDRVGRRAQPVGPVLVPTGPVLPGGDNGRASTGAERASGDTAPAPSAEALDLRLDRFGSAVLDIDQVSPIELAENGHSVPQIASTATDEATSESRPRTRPGASPQAVRRPLGTLADSTGIPQLTLASADPPPAPDTRIIVAALPDIVPDPSADAEEARLAIAPLSRLSIVPQAAPQVAATIGRLLGGGPIWSLK